MAGYLGSVPVPQATQHRESFTCTEGQTSFATAGYTPQFLDLYLNGSHLSPADFTATNGSDVVLAVAASADDVCDIISYTPFEIADQTFTGNTIMTNGDNTAQLELISTDADNSAGPLLDFNRNSASPADGDVTGNIRFIGENDAGESTVFSDIINQTFDVSNGTEDGVMYIRTMEAGTLAYRITMNPTETVFNDDSLDQDFRIESNNHDNIFFIDGGNDGIGIGNSTIIDWSTNYPGLQMGQAGALYGHKTSNQMSFAMNWGVITGNNYIVDGIASRMVMDTSKIAFDSSASGSAAGAITGIPLFQMTPAAGSHFNSDRGGVIDFQISSGSKTHMFFVDSGSDYVALGSADQNNGGMLNLNAVSGSTVSTMTCRSATDAHTNILTMLKTPATSGNYTATASGDILGDIRFMGVNTSAVADIGARIQVEQTGTSGSTVPASMQFITNESTAMTLNSAQEVGINTAPVGTVSLSVTADSSNHATLIKSVSSGFAASIVDNTAGGDFISFRENNSERGKILNSSNDFRIGGSVTNIAGLNFAHTKVLPMRALALVDNQVDLGNASYRWQVVYAGTGSINTSDENEKQNIAALTSAEMLVAKRISTLFKTFRFKDSVTDKGENARTHSGIIAQDVKAAFEAEGLTAANYGLWCSDTWWEHDVDVAAIEADDTADLPIEAVEAYTRTDAYETEDEAPSGSTKKTRLGIRYPELLSFLAAYNEQRFAAIETRLTALEG